MEVYKNVPRGFRLPHPVECPSRMFTLIERCWAAQDRRPTFAAIVVELERDAADESLQQVARSSTDGGVSVTGCEMWAYEDATKRKAVPATGDDDEGESRV